MPRKRQTQFKQYVDEWIARWGPVCPGYQRGEHKAHYRFNPLSVDHRIPKSEGGTDDPENLQILCRSCNSRKKNRMPGLKPGPEFIHPFNR